tara:strand:- start:559 stop:1293 length:735 start_codon:yes stop_codon:yes gene_type:complete
MFELENLLFLQQAPTGTGNLQRTFSDFLLNQPAQIDLSYLVISLILSGLLAWLLGKLYVRYGTALSNRKKFAGNFVLLTVTTTLIITVIKSSLALSLGLVGALSIVRFRAAIKEPEELAFLFLTISIGLGFGANQVAVTLIAFFIISIFIWARHFYYKKEESQNLYLSVSGRISRDLTLKKISEVIKKHSKAVHLKRFDKKDDILEASFLVDLDSFDGLEKLKNELSILSKSINISYLDKLGFH